VLVRLQLESALQRLRAAAICEASSRMDGWCISEAEVILKDELLIQGVPFSGVIDRIEIREKGGRAEVRLIDFKTGDKAQDPQAVHARKFTARSREAEPWQVCDLPGTGQFRWQNLQLPLYAAAMAAKGISNVQVAYFNLPKNIQDTVISGWDDFNQAWIDAGMQCASDIVRRIQDGIFWPPARVAFDNYSELFLGDVTTSVESPVIIDSPSV
jgi:hypothetical protein